VHYTKFKYYLKFNNNIKKFLQFKYYLFTLKDFLVQVAYIGAHARGNLLITNNRLN